jgi:hypothetical protein
MLMQLQCMPPHLWLGSRTAPLLLGREASAAACPAPSSTAQQLPLARRCHIMHASVQGCELCSTAAVWQHVSCSAHNL